MSAILTGLEAVAEAGTPEATVAALLAAAGVGVAEATPQLDGAAQPDLALLRIQATVALGRLRQRLAGGPVEVGGAGTPEGDVAATRTRAQARAEALTGMRLPLLGRVTVTLPEQAQGQLGTAGRLTGGEPRAVRTWLHDRARVRPAVDNLLAAFDIAESLRAASPLDPIVTQLPVATDDSWAGTSPSPRPGVVGLVVHREYTGALPDDVCGLVVDSWTETVPAPSHATGVAFHVDRPNASPPQAVLVAVPPDLSLGRPVASWDLDTLFETLNGPVPCGNGRERAGVRSEPGRPAMRGAAMTTTLAPSSAGVSEDDQRDALSAPVRDPLWMLARQWQTGGFLAEDAGSPAVVTHGHVTASMTLAGTEVAGPLEPLVQAEPLPTIGSLYGRSRIRLGAELRRLLRDEGAEGAVGALATAYPPGCVPSLPIRRVARICRNASMAPVPALGTPST